MINADMRDYNYFTLGEKDAYGQQTLSNTPTGKIKMAINIAVNEDEVVDRIAGRRMCVCGESYHISTYSSDTCAKCGQKLYQREDDKPQTVKSRLEVYNKQTAPLIEYYSNKGILYTVDGSQDIKDVYNSIVKVIDDNN